MTETRRERFGKFYKGLAEHIDSHHPSWGFYGYGSYFERPTSEPGDMDGGIVSPTLITDKRVVVDISRKIYDLTQDLSVPISSMQFNLLDRQSSIDGRFLSYSRDYVSYIKRGGVILAGDTNWNEFNGTDNRFNTHESTAFNFRRVRNSLLSVYSTVYGSADKAEREFAKLIDQVKRLPKKIAQLGLIRDYIREGRIDEVHDGIARIVSSITKEEALKDLGKLVGNADLSFYEGIKDYENPLMVEILLQKRDALLMAWVEAVGAYEEIVKGYIENNHALEVSVKTVI